MKKEKKVDFALSQKRQFIVILFIITFQVLIFWMYVGGDLYHQAISDGEKFNSFFQILAIGFVCNGILLFFANRFFFDTYSILKRVYRKKHYFKEKEEMLQIFLNKIREDESANTEAWQSLRRPGTDSFDDVLNLLTSELVKTKEIVDFLDKKESFFLRIDENNLSDYIKSGKGLNKRWR